MYSRSIFTLWLKILSIKIGVDTSFIHKGYLQRLLHSLIIITSNNYFFNYAFKNHPVEALQYLRLYNLPPIYVLMNVKPQGS